MYVVQPEKGGEVRVLHRNHLLPVGEKLRELDEEPEESEPKSKPKSKSSQKEGSKVVEEREEESSETSEDESKIEEVRPKRRRRKPDRLGYNRLGSPGDDRSKDRVLGCIVQLLEHQQVLVSMLSSVFGHFQKLNVHE